MGMSHASHRLEWWMRATNDDLGRKSRGRVDSFDLVFSMDDNWQP